MDYKHKVFPTLIPNLTNILQISGGYEHSMFLNQSGMVFSCGDNSVNY
jgi:alpha-tubulin suppressor-like RCC1 family protein